MPNNRLLVRLSTPEDVVKRDAADLSGAGDVCLGGAGAVCDVGQAFDGGHCSGSFSLSLSATGALGGELLKGCLGPHKLSVQHLTNRGVVCTVLNMETTQNSKSNTAATPRRKTTRAQRLAAHREHQQALRDEARKA